MAAINRASWLGLIITLATDPANRVLWLLLLFALGVTCYITHIAEPAKKESACPGRKPGQAQKG